MSVASERRMRLEATSLIGDQVEAELIPLVYPCKDVRGEEVKMTPAAYVKDLWEAVRNNLDKNVDETRG